MATRYIAGLKRQIVPFLNILIKASSPGGTVGITSVFIPMRRLNRRSFSSFSYSQLAELGARLEALAEEYRELSDPS